MLIYKNLFQTYGSGQWKGVALPTPFYSNQYMPFNEADNLEFQDVAINHLLVQRDDVSIYSTPKSTVAVGRRPENIHHGTISHRNDYTEFNGDMNGSAEGGDLSFGGEAIQAVVVRRSSSRSKFHLWEDIAIIPVTTASLYTLDKIIYDPYVEHGVTYQYAIQPVGSNGRGAQYETLRNTAVYDDIWMIGSDTKQLMMGYNPNVSGYKYVVKDAAVETIGSKYPYVIRNANVGYTQFQFSCTITAHMNLVDGKEVFTPFQDIDVYDEYKDIIVGEGGSTTGSTDTGQVERPKPSTPPKVTFLGGVRIRSNERPEDSTNILLAEPIAEVGPYNIMEQDLPGGAIKFECPISVIEAGGLVNLASLAAANGLATEYDRWVNGYEYTDSEGNLIVQPPHDWVPAFADDRYVKIITGGQTGLSLQEVSKIRQSSFTLPNIEVEKKVAKAYRDKISAKVNEKLFDPAYPSSPDYARSGIESNMTVVNSDNEYMVEREFRRRVMEFVYDGQPKIFKSPTEGLLLVKLSDISLTPNNSLGRMIYDFSCTCTEIGKVNSDTLAKYGFREARGDLLLTSLGTEIEAEMDAKEARELYELFRNK